MIHNYNENLDPFAFYVGKVIQNFNGTTQKIDADDISGYIDRENKTIKSVTGELFWNYDKGYVKYDTPYFQGAVGFYNGIDIQLTNVAIKTENDYITVACVSMDGKALCDSSKILIQVMTEDKFKGYETEENIIKDVGKPPLVVRDIHATLSFRGINAAYIIELNENGYICGRSKKYNQDSGKFSVEIGSGAIYTLLTDKELNDSDDYAVRENTASEDGFREFVPSKDSFDYSPIDMRFLNEDTAGQSGFVMVKDGKFALGNGEQVVFWAVNAGPGIINKPKEEIQYLARRLAKMGVNMVRMHGRVYDFDWGKEFNDFSELSAINADYLDKYHYFVYAMKQQGIYTKLSYYFPLWVKLKSSFGFEGYTGKYDGVFPFALFQYDKRFQAVYKSWAEKILLSENPYTGTPLAKEPAVAIIEIQNEDSYLFWTFSRRNIPEEQMSIIGKYFKEHLIKQYGSYENIFKAWGEDSKLDTDCEDFITVQDIAVCTSWGHGEGGKRKRASDQLRFLVEFQKKFYEEMYDYYRNEIKTPILISASNWMTAEPKLMEGLERYTYTATDVIDRHGYFEEGHTGDTATYRVMPGHTLSNITSLKNPDKAITQMNAIEGFPHIITETAFPAPNRFKGDSVPMWSMYGALQGVDGIFMFALGDTDWEKNPHMKWPILIPSVIGQFPAFGLMYRRGYIKESKPIVNVTHSLDELYNFKGMPIYETVALDNLRKENKNK